MAYPYKYRKIAKQIKFLNGHENDFICDDYPGQTLHEIIDTQVGLSQLFKGEPEFTLTLSSYVCTTPIYDKLIFCKCVSALLILSETVDSENIDTPLFAGSVNLIRNTFIIKLYKTSLKEIREESSKFLCPSKPFVLLDLDKTLILNYVDTRNITTFYKNFTARGLQLVSNDYFEYDIMIRPGAHWFLHRLQQFANVFIITAGDISYAQQIVNGANELNWITPLDPTTNGQISYACSTSVTIPISNVVSVRHKYRDFIKKTFSHVLPFHFVNQQQLEQLRLIAVDDDLSAWNSSVNYAQNHVINVEPFHSNNINHRDLLYIVDAIEIVELDKETKPIDYTLEIYKKLIMIKDYCVQVTIDVSTLDGSVELNLVTLF